MPYKIKFDKKTVVDDIFKLITDIPQEETELDLDGSPIPSQPIEEVTKIFEAFPNRIKSIDLSSTYLTILKHKDNTEAKSAEWTDTFLKLPRALQTVNLSNNAFGYAQNLGILPSILQALPSTLRELDLSQNSLDKLTDLDKIIAEVPQGVRILRLAKNGLNNLKVEQWLKLLAAIPTEVWALDLQDNNLVSMGETLTEVLAAIPSHFSKLNLSDNAFSRLIKLSLVTSDLQVETKKARIQLAKILSAIPAHITSLDLSNNGLSHYCYSIDGVNELAQVFLAIPNTVTYLDLSGNDLEKQTEAEQSQLFKALPSSVKTVQIEGKIIDLTAFRKMMPMDQQIDNEIKRLESTSLAKCNFWNLLMISLGLLKKSDDKIIALQAFKNIIHKNALTDQSELDPEEKALKASLIRWKTENKQTIDVQRNSLHRLFRPNHKPTTAKTIDDIYMACGITEGMSP